MSTKTVSCTCKCPKILHSYVGCLVKGCYCWHGSPLPNDAEAEVLGLGYRLEYWPDHFRKEWAGEHPGEDFDYWLQHSTPEEIEE